ncbi:MAG TPA: hypothetical protein VHC22_14260 [Pirellulales bacterium]|nr:hypothetical protein [Pirellulales bacterium]
MDENPHQAPADHDQPAWAMHRPAARKMIPYFAVCAIGITSPICAAGLELPGWWAMAMLSVSMGIAIIVALRRPGFSMDENPYKAPVEASSGRSRVTVWHRIAVLLIFLCIVVALFFFFIAVFATITTIIHPDG